MTFDVEIMLRGDERVFTERLSSPRPPAEWTGADAKAVLEDILRAIDRVLNPGHAGDVPVSLRGVSWIVSSYRDAVVIALEIHSASAVAGPFDIELDALEALVGRAVQLASPPQTVH